MAIGYVSGFAGAAGLSPMAAAVRSLYGMVIGINEFIDDHIEKLKSSENTTVSRTGLILEGAKYGFGLGYISSVVIIATGQLLLGNGLMAVASAAGTVITAVTLTNPIAMTCAAVGAIYYGWGALSTQEQAEILDKLSKGLEIGVELIKSVVHFLILKTKEIFGAKNIAEFKKYIKEYSAKFGKTLYDVTGKMTDFVKGAADKAGEMTTVAVDNTSAAFKVAGDKAGEAASDAADATFSAMKEAYEKAGDAAGTLKSSAKRALARRKKGETASPSDEQGST